MCDVFVVDIFLCLLLLFVTVVGASFVGVAIVGWRGRCWWQLTTMIMLLLCHCWSSVVLGDLLLFEQWKWRCWWCDNNNVEKMMLTVTVYDAGRLYHTLVVIPTESVESLQWIVAVVSFVCGCRYQSFIVVLFVSSFSFFCHQGRWLWLDNGETVACSGGNYCVWPLLSLWDSGLLGASLMPSAF